MTYQGEQDNTSQEELQTQDKYQQGILPGFEGDIATSPLDEQQGQHQEDALASVGPGDSDGFQGSNMSGNTWENHGAAYGEAEAKENILDRKALRE
jgi:hypothetical protein